MVEQCLREQLSKILESTLDIILVFLGIIRLTWASLGENGSQSPPQMSLRFALERQSESKGRPQKPKGTRRTPKSHINESNMEIRIDLLEAKSEGHARECVSSQVVATTLRQHACDKLSEVIGFGRVLEVKG